MIVFYGYDKCSTCRKAKRQLQAWGIGFEEIDVTQNPPPEHLLESLLSGGDYKVSDLFNKSGQQYRELHMKERLKQMSQDEAVALLARNGRLVKRPIVTDGSRHSVGFHPDRFAQIWAP